MTRTNWIFILLIASQTAWAQTTTNKYAAIDKKALLLPDSLTHTTDRIAGYMTANFAADSDRARAIFIWIASILQTALN